MRKPFLASVVVALCGVALAVAAEEAAEMPEMPKPQKEHQWLQKMVGQWDTEGEITMDPSQPPIKTQGTETVDSFGGFWVVTDVRGEMMGHQMRGSMTLGYDPAKGKYVGTWIDSMNNYLWIYEGTLDESGKKLTLDTEGPCPMRPGGLSKFKEVIEWQGDDVRVFTSSIQGEDGQWTTPMKMTSRRKK